LKLGGAAAAAGVAAVAAGATELAHPGTAEAAVTWSTGEVLADQETYLLWGTNVYADTNMLTVQFGIDGIVNQALPARTAIEAYNAQKHPTAPAYAIYATSWVGEAIHGACDSGNGMVGHSNTLHGVVGLSNSGFGVVGQSTTGFGGVFQGAGAQLFLTPNPGTTPPAGPYQHGTIFVDQNATVWVCIADGPPATWVRLTGVSSTAAGGAITYLSTPVRLLDARGGASSGLVNRGALAGNELFTFGVAGLGGSGIPGTAQGLIGNVTVLGPSGTGNLSLFPAGGAVPTVASMTFGSPGLFLANGVNVAIGSGGAINIQNQSSGTTPLVLDAVAFVS
jgi:hypothetical protein